MDEVDMCSKWYSSKDDSIKYKKFCSTLRKGNIVQIKFPEADCPYRWAICIQESPQTNVAHRFDDPSKYQCEELRKFAKGTVQKVTLDTLSEGAHVRINNFRDSVSESKKVPEIVKQVLEALSGNPDQHFGPYCPRTNNDANFVEVARYGRDVLLGRLGDNGRSQWYGMEDKEAFLWLLKKGDIVEFNKDRHRQWAVCISEPHVQESFRELIFRYSLGDISGSSWTPEGGTILFSTFEDVARSCRFRIDNFADLQYSPNNPDDICKTASKKIHLSSIGRYRILKNNSWHFAMRLRYGMDLGLREPCNGPTNMTTKEGDIIQFKRANGDNDWAIFISKDKEGKIPSKLAYRHSSGNSPPAKATVRLATLEFFFSAIAEEGEFSIQDSWDTFWTPRVGKDIMVSVLQADGQEDPCQCDLFVGICPHFVVGQRYGVEAKNKMLTALSGWCSHRHLDVFMSEVLRAGDIVEIKGGFHPHFAIYIGDGHVVHCCDRGGEDRNDHDLVEIRWCSLEYIVDEGEIRINNFLNFSHESRRSEDIVRRALEAVKDIQTFDKFNQDSNNCRHFAKQMKYNLKTVVFSDSATDKERTENKTEQKQTQPEVQPAQDSAGKDKAEKLREVTDDDDKLSLSLKNKSASRFRKPDHRSRSDRPNPVHSSDASNSSAVLSRVRFSFRKLVSNPGSKSHKARKNN